ncbi:MAG: hypothetical protein KC505_00565 [Myxococcales bacterium]|nr:hypothetical protein [Myxococcales bacterium]USN51239.1 MAG: hypothetical protein H6731_02200 [Myxococcales bacterium]
MNYRKKKAKSDAEAILFLNALDLNEPALIELGGGDEAIRYYARLSPIKDSNKFKLHLHEGSLLLDALRMKRCLQVNMLIKEYRCEASISLSGSGIFIVVSEYAKIMDTQFKMIFST